MSPEEGFMFWAIGCRNWTCSLSLLPEKEKVNKKSQAKHFLKGVISKITGYRISHRSDSNAFFSGALEHVREVLQAKPKDKAEGKRKAHYGL
ncbi:hypothetical protein [Methanosarcina sp. WH1]|uniref:hypothetical protein n=1 Tax=Methanosarcina sp. WH1 TaxID=1434102 RepID=UPI0018CE3CF3|nr:hypothetical protein [Methanosarcina sp. WH1]